MDVFLGSSRMLSDLRLGFAALVDTLADPAFDSCGEEITARMWESESYSMERDRSKQAAYDEMIRQCDLAFFLVDGFLGKYTYHEYLVAVESYAKRGKPSITVWVRLKSVDSKKMLPTALTAPVEFSDSNTRLLVESATTVPGVGVRALTSQNAVLIDMLELMVCQLGSIPLQLRGDGVWIGYKRLVSLDGLPKTRVDALSEWIENR